MIHAIQTRIWNDTVQVRGVIEVFDGSDAIAKCMSLELPWKNNARRMSCIPPRPYETKRYILRHREPDESASFKYPHFLVEGVQDRSYILWHAGNLYTHTSGCTLVGSAFTDMNADGYPDAQESRATLHSLRTKIPDQTPLLVQWMRAEKITSYARIRPMYRKDGYSYVVNNLLRGT